MELANFKKQVATSLSNNTTNLNNFRDPNKGYRVDTRIWQKALDDLSLEYQGDSQNDGKIKDTLTSAISTGTGAKYTIDDYEADIK